MKQTALLHAVMGLSLLAGTQCLSAEQQAVSDNRESIISNGDLSTRTE